MIKIETPGIIWDLDGTVLDSFSVLYDVLKLVLAEHQLPMPTREVMQRNFHGKLDESFAASMPDLDRTTIDRIVADFLVKQNPVYADLTSHVFADALDLMQRAQLAGKTQVAVTNRSHENRGLASPRSIITREPLTDLISAVVCGDNNPFHKPDPRMLEVLINQTGLNAHDFTVIGDQAVDAELAHNLGVKAVLVARDNSDIPHLEQLGDNYDSFVTVTGSLFDIAV